MTGFANHAVMLLEQENEQCVLDIEIKTFNSRFFEATCKLPAALSAQEGEVLTKLKDKLFRGRVYCTVRILGVGSLFERVTVSPLRVREYVRASEQLKEQFKFSGDLTIQDIMALPNVFTSDRTLLSDEVIMRFFEGIDAAIAMTVESREREGAFLRRDIMQRFDAMHTLIGHIEEKFSRLMATQRGELAMVKQKSHDGDIEATALLNERYVSLDKLDVHEEIVRFRAHLDAVRQLFSGNGVEKGRKLDFILQELMREINTIMSKSANYELSAHAVDVKVELEKVREQAQNIV